MQHLTSIHAQIWKADAKPGLIMHIDQIRSIYNVDVSVSVSITTYQLPELEFYLKHTGINHTAVNKCIVEKVQTNLLANRTLISLVCHNASTTVRVV